MAALEKSKWISQVSGLYYLGTVNVCTEFHGNPSHSG